MTEAIATRGDIQAETLEKVLLGGNLSVLSAPERMTYYRAVCESVGLNPLTRPFEYLSLSGKLVLYARREATDQLRKIHGVSIGKLEKTFHADDLYIVEAPATDKNGRTDSSTGAVNIKGLTGEAKANALMKAETKAKRRVTLSICGLGMLDETEVETIPGAVREEFYDDVPSVDISEDLPPPTVMNNPKAEQQSRFVKACHVLKDRMTPEAYYGILGASGYEHANEITDRTTQETVYHALTKAADEGKTKTQTLKEKVKAAAQ